MASFCEAREEHDFNGAISSIATRTKCFSVVIIQYSVYEINARAAKFNFEVRCLFLHRALGGEKKSPLTSIKRSKCRKLIIVEVHYIHFNTDTHCFRKTLPVGGKSRRVKDNELPEIFTVLQDLK